MQQLPRFNYISIIRRQNHSEHISVIVTKNLIHKAFFCLSYIIYFIARTANITIEKNYSYEFLFLCITCNFLNSKQVCRDKEHDKQQRQFFHNPLLFLKNVWNCYTYQYLISTGVQMSKVSSRAILGDFFLETRSGR